MKKTDVLWLVEHTVREMDVTCAVKSLAQARYGINITVRNIYLHANDAMKEYIPSVVVFPFLYRISDLAIGDYVEVWPRATYFNLAWEQVHYKAHLKMKAPGDEFTRQGVTHHAWGEFYMDYLLESGVPPERIFVNGNPVYQLYKEPYRRYFKPRDQLAREYDLDPSKRWVFIPENYKWAFFSDDKLQRSASRGGNMDEHLNMRDFCQQSLGHLLRWCNEAAQSGDLEIIFRPRPATNSQQMEAFFKENAGVPSKYFHMTKAETVRDWILASDVVISSYSTSLIEAAVACKPIYMVEPIPIPESLQCDWYEFVPRIYRSAEFEEACLTSAENGSHELQRWTEEKMLANGDPINGLADFIGHLVEGAGASKANLVYGSFFSTGLPIIESSKARVKRRFKRLNKYSSKAMQTLLSTFKAIVLYLIAILKPNSWGTQKRSNQDDLSGLLEHLTSAAQIFSEGFKNRNYFNPLTHENDVFTEVEVHERVEKWSEILAND
jgi:surface carbohydrate biosynthesis protein